MKQWACLLLTTAIVISVTGCSSVSLDENAPKGAAPIVQAGEGPAQSKPATSTSTAPMPPAQAPASRGAATLTEADLRSGGFGPDRRASVYFEFDQTVIRREDQPVLEAAATLLTRFAAISLTIEGNTDDRGTSEYNLALGQRRAEAVKRALGVLGVEESRVDAVSNGEEKPRKAGGTESAYAENRRADLILR